MRGRLIHFTTNKGTAMLSTNVIRPYRKMRQHKALKYGRIIRAVAGALQHDAERIVDGPVSRKIVLLATHELFADTTRATAITKMFDIGFGDRAAMNEYRYALTRICGSRFNG